MQVRFQLEEVDHVFQCGLVPFEWIHRLAERDVLADVEVGEKRWLLGRPGDVALVRGGVGQVEQLVIREVAFEAGAVVGEEAAGCSEEGGFAAA